MLSEYLDKCVESFEKIHMAKKKLERLPKCKLRKTLEEAILTVEECNKLTPEQCQDLLVFLNNLTSFDEFRKVLNSASAPTRGTRQLTV